MYDVNDHPKQKELNTAIAIVVSNTIKQLNVISNEYKVGKKELLKQYIGSLNMFLNDDLLNKINKMCM